jgi:Ser/Thr protein kinase RdoA (MazF antagonist)
MTTILRNIVQQFLIKGELKNIFPYGSGHINDTYKVETDQKNYLLQRINHTVFKNVEGLTRNLIAISEFLRHNLHRESGNMQLLKSIPTKEKLYITQDHKRNYWRIFDFVEESRGYDRVENPEIAFEGGKTYGWFVRMLSDFPVSQLVETIPHFHSAKFRIGNFKKAVMAGSAGRVAEVKLLIDYLMERSSSMMHIFELAKEGRIPLRVTHNDTKINNVLFDTQNRGICVIDMDTVMPGYVHFDFGDAIRTFANSADEDEKDLGKVSVNMKYFEAFTRGFLSQTNDILIPEEVDSLAFSAKYITYEQTIRFLTDYLEGDRYYKVKYPQHNLIRSKAQAKLLMSMEAHFPQMEDVIKKNT